MDRVFIRAKREKYSSEEVRGMTVEQLIRLLERCNPKATVVLSHDDGYSYGGIQKEDVKQR